MDLQNMVPFNNNNLCSYANTLSQITSQPFLKEKTMFVAIGFVLIPKEPHIINFAIE